MANELIIKINKDSKGNNVSLTNMPVEAADALNAFINSLSKFVKSQNDSDFKISLQDGCIATSLVYSNNEINVDNEIDDVIDGKSSNLDYYDLLKSIQNKIRANGLDYSVIHKINNKETDLTKEFKSKKFILIPKEERTGKKRVIFISGRLFECGGKKKINIHIENNQFQYVVDCSEENAKKINRFLYEDVYLSILKHSCIGQKDALSLIDIYSAQEYDEYKSFFEKVENNKELVRFDIVYNRILEIIKNEETNYNLLKTIKLYLNSQAEIGIIRTILLLIKPLKNDDNEINEVYQQLVTIIKEHY